MLKRLLGILATGILLSLPYGPAAKAQQVNLYCLLSGPPLTWAPCSGSNPLAVNASVSASITGFPGTSQSTGTPFTATTGGATGTLPAGTEVVVSNVGTTNGAYCKLGGSASTSDQLIPPQSWFGFTVGSNTQVTCITSTSTTTINMVGGSGLPTGSGGGGGGGGGGGNVNLTQVGGASYALGQQLAAASLPVVLTAAQISTLTPLSTVAVTQSTSPWIVAGSGTAGTPGTAVMTVQGISGGTAVPVSLTSTTITGTVAATQSGTWNITNVSGTVSLPTGAATSALQTTGNTALTTINTTLGSPFQAGGSIGNTSFAVTQATASNLNMTCANCSGSGASGTDEGGFTAGSSVFAPSGGFFQTTATSNPLTTGQWGAWQMTANRAGFVNLRDTSGAALGVSGNPLFNQLAAGAATIGSIANTSFAATQSGTWNIGSITTLPALVAGSAIIGKVGIDQTTPGTTNLVSIGTNGTVNPTTIGNWGLAASTQNGTTPTNAQLVMGQFNTTPTTITSGNISPIQIDSAGNMLVNIKAATGIAQGATTSGLTGSLVMGSVTTSAPSYTTAQTSPLSLDTAGNLRINCITGCGGSGGTSSTFGSAFPTTGTAIGLTNGTNMVAWSATSNYGTSPGAIAVPAVNADVTNSITIGTNAALVAGSAIIGNVRIDQTTVGTTNGVSLAQIGATTVATGNGVSGAGSQRVNIASDNTAFAVNATLQASSATAIGTVNPTTAANWGIGTSTQNSASVANGTMILGQFNTTPTTITSGNMSPLQLDNAGNVLVNIKAGASSGAVAQGSTTSGQTGGLIQCAATSSPPTYTTATTNPVNCDTAGNIRVNVTSATGLTQGSTTSGQSGSLVMGAVTTSAPTYTATQTSPLSLDTAGNLRTSVSVLPSAGTTGSAVPATAIYTGANGSGNLTGEIVCDNFITYDASTSGSTQLVALSSGKTIYVCGYAISTGATATNVKLIYGTGTACVTSPQPVTPAYELGINSGIVDHASNHWGGMKTAASNELCLNTSAGNPVQATVYYTQF